MRVEIRLFATLAAYLPPGTAGDSAELTAPEGATVGDIARLLRIPSAVPCLTVVNGRDAAPDQPLADGDVITMFPPLVGG